MIEQEGIKIESKLVDKKSRITLVTISGYVDQANCHLLQKTIDQCLADECYNLIFDFQHLVYMSSAGWGVLIGEIKRFRENGGDIKLANMGPEIYEIYQMLEFYHIISEYPSVEEALKSFNAFTEMEAFVPLPIETGNDKGVVENE
ncbi:MAG: anti-sigma factor antagonist, partial [Calditrichaeota bacterium]